MKTLKDLGIKAALSSVLTILTVFAALSVLLFAGCAENLPTSDETGKLSEESEAKGDSVAKTYKKYFTLSFDDGTTEDEKMIELLKKYGIKASFCINTGLMDGNDVIEVAGSWKRMSFDYAKENKVYEGFDVISHGYRHKELTFLSDDEIISEIKNDSEKIRELTGFSPVGFAYPGGTAYYNGYITDVLSSSTGVRFARDTNDTFSFYLPENFMAWSPTCSILDNKLFSVAEKFINAEATEDMLFYVWDHPWAITAYNAWDKVEKLFKMLAERDDIVFVSNTEFYDLFSADIPSEPVL